MSQSICIMTLRTGCHIEERTYVINDLAIQLSRLFLERLGNCFLNKTYSVDTAGFPTISINELTLG